MLYKKKINIKNKSVKIKNNKINRNKNIKINKNGINKERKIEINKNKSANIYNKTKSNKTKS